jgi:hypothetical protein
MMWQPEMVYVNLNGQRWIDETESKMWTPTNSIDFTVPQNMFACV